MSKSRPARHGPNGTTSMKAASRRSGRRRRSKSRAEHSDQISINSGGMRSAIRRSTLFGIVHSESSKMIRTPRHLVIDCQILRRHSAQRNSTVSCQFCSTATGAKRRRLAAIWKLSKNIVAPAVQKAIANKARHTPSRSSDVALHVWTALSRMRNDLR